MQLSILQRKHDHFLAGHLGITRTAQLVERTYHWPGSKKTIVHCISSCLVYARDKLRRQKQPITAPQNCGPPLVSHINGLHRGAPRFHGSSAHNSILVVIDRFTKGARFLSTTITANPRDLANFMAHNIFLKHGKPDSIVSDRGAKFVGLSFAEFAYNNADHFHGCLANFCKLPHYFRNWRWHWRLGPRPAIYR